MDEIKLGPMHTTEVVARMRQRVIDARLRSVTEQIRTCLSTNLVPDTTKIMDEVYHLRHIIALDAKEDTADIIQTYLEYFSAFELIDLKGSDALYSIVFNLIHHIAFTFAEHPYPVIPFEDK